MQMPILSQDAVIQLTNRTQSSARALILDALGINFKLHPIDGKVITTEEAVKFAFGAQAPSSSPSESASSSGPRWTRSLRTSRVIVQVALASYRE